VSGPRSRAHTSHWKSLLAAMLLGMSACITVSSAHAGDSEIEKLQAPPRALTASPASPAATPAATTMEGPEPRVALVIGNANYQNAPPLDNPDNDAHAVAQLLNSAGFEVITAIDLTQNEMLKVMQDFSSRIAARGPKAVAMIYYAGHGVQLAGENYLIPIDARITAPSDLTTSTIRLVDLMATLDAIPNRLRIVVLDACRNNPFPAVNDAGRGLAIVDAPNGSIVGYSTSPGEEALDGRGEHSPYAQAFLNLARQPNLPIEQLFKRIRLQVNQTTDGRQTPWESSSLTSDFTFFGDTLVAAARPAENAPVIQMAANLPSRSVRQAYDYVLSENRPQYYREFIELYPRDPLANRIRALLAGLLQAAAWHQTVLANSPAAYKSFSEIYSDSPYAPVALRLQVQPRIIPVLQPGRLMMPPHLAPAVHPLNLGDRPGLTPKLPLNSLPPRPTPPSTVVSNGNPADKSGSGKIPNTATLAQGKKGGWTGAGDNQFKIASSRRTPRTVDSFKPRPVIARGPKPTRDFGAPHLAQSGPRMGSGGFGRRSAGFH